MASTASGPHEESLPASPARLPSLPLVRALLILGGALWGGWYFGMDWIGWGEPGSARYKRYELYNRIAPAVLLLLAGATQGVHRVLHHRGYRSRWGSIGAHLASVALMVMALGSALEFWLFTDTSYGAGSLRGLGWGTYCLGLLLFYIGTAFFGAVLRRVSALHGVGTLLLCWLPAGALSAGVNAVLGTRLPGFALAVALCGAGYMLLGLRLPSLPSVFEEGLEQQPGGTGNRISNGKKANKAGRIPLE